MKSDSLESGKKQQQMKKKKNSNANYYYRYCYYYYYYYYYNLVNFDKKYNENSLFVAFSIFSSPGWLQSSFPLA